MGRRKILQDMSQDLIWSIVRNNSFFFTQCRNNGKLTLTTEPNNLTGFNTFKYSGLANKKVVGLSANTTGAGCVLSIKAKKGKATRQPAKMFSKFTLTKNFRRVAKTIVNET